MLADFKITQDAAHRALLSFSLVIFTLFSFAKKILFCNYILNFVCGFFYFKKAYNFKAVLNIRKDFVFAL